MRRYFLKGRESIAVGVGGEQRIFHPQFFDERDGMPGYRALPAGLSKAQRDMFYEVTFPDRSGAAPVERATAVPGGRRSKSKPAATPEVPEAAPDPA